MNELIKNCGAAKEKDGYNVSYSCSMCGHTVEAYAEAAVSEAEAISKTKNDAVHFFNKCHSCGRWVCDLHYNEDVMTCVECTPRKIFCSECGGEAVAGEKYCTKCGHKF